MGNTEGPFDLNIRTNGNELRHVDIFYPENTPGFEGTQVARTVLLLQAGDYLEFYVRSRMGSTHIMGGSQNSNASIRLGGA